MLRTHFYKKGNKEEEGLGETDASLTCSHIYLAPSLVLSPLQSLSKGLSVILPSLKMSTPPRFETSEQRRSLGGASSLFSSSLFFLVMPGDSRDDHTCVHELFEFQVHVKELPQSRTQQEQSTAIARAVLSLSVSIAAAGCELCSSWSFSPGASLQASDLLASPADLI